MVIPATWVVQAFHRRFAASLLGQNMIFLAGTLQVIVAKFSKTCLAGRAAAVVLASSVVYSGDAMAVVTVDFTLSPPGVQVSPLQNDAGSLTEDFDSLSVGSLSGSGSFAVGSYSASNMTISAADAYGGAGGTGRYISTIFSNGTGGTLSLSLSSPSKYAGFWWSAGNAGNTVKAYGTGNTLLASFDSSQITTLLGPFGGPNNAILATDDNSYLGAAYYGNPNPGLVSPYNEPYVYVNLRLSDPSVSFTGLEFSGPVFEFDNLTISPSYYNPTASVPGPLPALGGAAAFGWSRRLRQRLRARR